MAPEGRRYRLTCRLRRRRAAQRRCFGPRTDGLGPLTGASWHRSIGENKRAIARFSPCSCMPTLRYIVELPGPRSNGLLRACPGLRRGAGSSTMLFQNFTLTPLCLRHRPRIQSASPLFALRPRCASGSTVLIHHTDGSPPTRCLSAPSLTQEVGEIGELRLSASRGSAGLASL